MSLTKALIAAAGNAAPLYVDDVFSTWLYTGNGSTQTITNGIDLDGKGGLTWFKSRSAATDHQLFDTVRGATKELISNSTAAEATDADTLTAFNANGFSLGADANINTSSATYASWTFRKAPKFFDVVTYTGTGSNRTIAHDLGVAPGMIIVKRTDTTGDWQVYHRSLANTEYLVLNTTAAKATGATRWNSTTPTSTEFSLGTDTTVNASGGTYVAYLFAHDAGGFGLSGTDNVISCGGFTTDGSGKFTSVNLGWEPQYLLVKRTNSAGDWVVVDSMRGFDYSNGADTVLLPNSSAAEAYGGYGVPTATGFSSDTTGSSYSLSSTYVYIAIRRGPMKVPTSGTSVFTPTTFSTASGSNQIISSPEAIDMGLLVHAPVNGVHYVATRLIGNNATLQTQSTASESTTGTAVPTPISQNAFTNSMFFRIEGGNQTFWNATASGTNCFYGFRRAPGFFDVVCYTGTGSARTVAHNLGAVPELMIVKKRSAADAWVVYANNDNTDYLVLNTTAATVDDNTIWNDTSPTASVFTVGTNDDVNGNTATFVAYLFATVAGVSKVGSYTGSGTTKQIDCGFTGGARFVLIKRTDSTGDWYVWDTARGIVAGNDPYILLNSTAAEVTSTDYVDSYSAGFEISSTAPAAINASGGTFIYLAIA